jgi:hypothetical protein
LGFISLSGSFLSILQVLISLKKNCLADYRGTEEQRNRGTEEQRNRGTEEQRNRGTEEQKNIFKI